jgi:hypothetical protein
MGYLELGDQELIDNLLEKETLTAYEQKELDQKMKK